MRSRFPFPITRLSFGFTFHSVGFAKKLPLLYQKNKTPNYIGDCRAWSANLLQPTNEETCHFYLHFFYRLLWNKELGAYESCTGYLLQDMWEPNKPGWTPLSCRAPVFCKSATSSCALHHNNPIPPLLTASVLSSRDSLLVLSQLLCPGLFPSCAGDSWVPTGHDCRHRWESGPAMASICRVGPVRFCDAFISFSPYLSLEFMAWLRRREPSAVKGWPGSNSVPINTFQREVAGIRSQLEVYLFRWMIMERLKTAGLKRARFTANKPTGDHLYASERLSCLWKWTRGEISHDNSFAH